MAGQRAAVERVLVVGGGLAGLSLAIALGKEGVEVEVVDVTDRVEKVGLGLIARVMHAFEELGVLDDCRADGFVMPGFSSIFTYMFDSAGRPITLPGIEPPRETRLPAAIMMYRPTLIRILRDHAIAHGARLRIGVTVQTMTQTADRVDVMFTDGGSDSYDLVVGADGVRSHVRGLVHGPEVRPNYIGRISLRWAINNAPKGPAGFYCAKGTMVAVSHLPGRVAYVATGYGMPYTQVNKPDAVHLLRQVLDRFSAPHLAELRQRLTSDQDVNVKPYGWLLVDRPWHRGRITVIGDAAHATTDHLTSIGGMAVEDAVVLAQELTKVTSVEKALDTFQERRFDRVSMVVETSKHLLRMQLEDDDPLASAIVRNKALRMLMDPY